MIDFDHILQKIGNYGRYQIVASVALSYGSLPLGMMELAWIFMAYIPEYRCSVPLFENSTLYPNLTEEEILNLTTPVDSSGEPLDPCVRYGYSLSQCSDGGYSCVNKTEETIPCDNGYYYDDSIFTNTIVTEFDLVCDREALTYVSSTAYRLGAVVSAVVFPYFADRYGRRPTMIVTSIGMSAISLGATFCRSLQCFSVGRFFQAGFAGTCYGVAYVHAMEIVGINWRGFVGIGLQTLFVIGCMIWSGIAYYWPDWHQMQFAIFLVWTPVVISSFIFPESARWLFALEREEEGKRVVKTMAKYNKVALNDTLWEEAKIDETTTSNMERTYSWLDLVRTPGLRKLTLKISIIGASLGISFYGVVLNLGSWEGNIFLNNIYAGIIDIVTAVMTLILVNYIGRRMLSSVFFIVTAVFLIAYELIIELAEDGEAAFVTSTIAILLGRSFIGCAYIVAGILATELFPTVIRNTGLAAAGLITQLGGMFGPVIIMLQNDIPWLPNTIFAALAIVAGLLTLTLQETRGEDLIETIEHAELFYAGKLRPSQKMDEKNERVVDFTYENTLAMDESTKL